MEQKGYMILASAFNKQEVEKVDLQEVFAQVKELASNPTPDNRFKIAELVGYTTNTILNQRLNFLQAVADVKNGAEGDKPEFDVPYTGVIAKILAKGSTPEVSKIASKKTVLPTAELSCRPTINYQDLVQRPEKLMAIIEEAVLKMENAMVQYIQDANYAVFSTLGSPNYASGAGIVSATFDAQLAMVQRFGRATITGDSGVLTKFTALTGFSNRVADDLMIEANNNRFLGIYKGANLVEMTNRYMDDSSLANTNLALRNDLVYITPSGDIASRPLKVFLGGSMRSMDRTNPEDESYEIFMRMEVGVGVIGNQKRSAVYEDTQI